MPERLRSRIAVAGLFAGCASLSAISAACLIFEKSNFPAWFAPMPPVVLACLSLLNVSYAWGVLKKPHCGADPSLAARATVWALLIISVICTSSLHRFFPFRLDFVAWWQAAPAGFHLIKYNYCLTALSLAAIATLGITYAFGHRHAAGTGLVVLATFMLVPNDACANDFNGPWVRWLGASPMMFLPNATIVLAGFCALNGLWTRSGITTMIAIEILVLGLGLSHTTGLIW